MSPQKVWFPSMWLPSHRKSKDCFPPLFLFLGIFHFPYSPNSPFTKNQQANEWKTVHFFPQPQVEEMRLKKVAKAKEMKTSLSVLEHTSCFLYLMGKLFTFSLTVLQFMFLYCLPEFNNLDFANWKKILLFFCDFHSNSFHSFTLVEIP